MMRTTDNSRQVQFNDYHIVESLSSSDAQLPAARVAAALETLRDEAARWRVEMQRHVAQLDRWLAPVNALLLTIGTVVLVWLAAFEFYQNVCVGAPIFDRRHKSHGRGSDLILRREDATLPDVLFRLFYYVCETCDEPTFRKLARMLIDIGFDSLALI
jgi:hypothetical protein